ncbi:MAG: hypothetical protein SH850_26955 [Planctomycetaceae bacterium]|nr:hypothetical protein [Planctomycetaceae bacterium]
MMYVAYPLLLVITTFRARRGDAFVVTSNTFFAPALVALFTRWRGVYVVHLLYDLFPDAIEVAGRTCAGSGLSRLLGYVTWANQHWTNGTVYLGDFLRVYAERRWGKTRLPGVIPIATDVRLYESVPPAPAPPAPLSLHYGGQLGLMHDVESLLLSLQLLSDGGVLGHGVVFDGRVSGSRAAHFESTLRTTAGVVVGGTLSSDAWRRHARGFQVGVVTLSPGGATVCLPSKTYAMMAAGLAILAICPAWSDLAKLVEETGAGWIVDNAASRRPLDEPDYLAASRSRRPINEVAADFRAIVARLLENPSEVAERRKNAWHSVRERYSPSQIGNEWSAYLEDLIAGPARS